MAYDVRDPLMLLIGRFWYEGLGGNSYLPRSGIYEAIVGCCRVTGTGAQASAQSIRVILENACTIRQGRRSDNQISGSEDRLDSSLYEHMKASYQSCRLFVNVLSEVSCCYSLQAIITCLVCDGGPSEQAAVPLLQRDLFPNATMVSRDRAHRARSITKGVWGPLNEQCQGLLGLFTTDDQSISRMLQKLGLFANSVVTELLLHVLNPSLLLLIASAKELQQILPDISRDSDQQRCQIHQSIEKFLFRFTAIQLIVRSPFQTVPFAS